MKMEMWITNRFGEKLETVVRKPDGDGKFPTIIFVSGIGANLHETNNSHDEIAEKLVHAGFVTVQFSFAGRGNSEGDYEKMTLSRQGAQVDDVIEWTKKQPFCDTNKIGMYAMSFGVASSLQSSLQNVTSLCLTSGAYLPKESLKKLFELRGEYHPDGISWRKFSTGEIVRFPSSFWQDLESFNGMKIASTITTPTLIIHGDNDLKISESVAQSVYSAIQSTKKEIKIFIGGDHGIIDVPRTMREEFLHTVVKWFLETL
jgi:dienelactone hydrolase